MYIKSVNIQGFKSYREQMNIENFSPRHNVVVGRNGSGKSNFFFAIQFVLSDEFTHLRSEQRTALLHEGVGQQKTHTAKVEIVFDNTDGRIPIEKDEVRLVRQIGLKKDQYFLDNRCVTRAEVQNLMESAGFSRSNPYYIVKQGKINELATAQDPVRLKLLKEVAGTRVYDERKEESTATMRDTENKRDKIESLLKYIEDRLSTLEEEKEELKEYQKWDKMKRSLEYTLYEQEQRENRMKETKLLEQREEINDRKMNLVSQQTDVSSQLHKVKRSRRDLETRFAGLKDERETLNADQTQHFQQKTQMQLRVKDLNQELEVEGAAREKAEKELHKLRKEIADKTAKRDEIAPKFHKLQERESELDTEIKIHDARRHELYGKQGAKDRFESVAERDKHIDKELRSLQRQMQQEEDSVERLQRDMATDDAEHDALREQMAKFTQSVEQRRLDMDDKSRDKLTHVQEREKLIDARKELWREEHAFDAKMAQLQDDIAAAEGLFRSAAGKGAAQGMQSVRRVLQVFKERGGYDDVLGGYHGTLISNLKTDSNYFRAVDTIAGARLFYHIVDTDHIVTKIMAEFNRMKLPGDVSFFPLNRLTDSAAPQYPRTDMALPMSRILESNTRVDPVLRTVFSRSMICRTIEVCTQLAKEHRLDCVTMDGDVVSARGTITGGYVNINKKRSRLELQDTLNKLVEQRDEFERRQTEIRHGLSDADRNLTEVERRMQEFEHAVQRTKGELGKMQEERRVGQERLHSIQRNRRPKEHQLLQLQSFIKQLTAKRADKTAEKGQTMEATLTADEQTQLNTIEQETMTMKAEFEKVNAKRRRLDDEKSVVENELEARLMPRRQTLEASVSDMGVAEKQHDLNRLRNELHTLQTKISDAATKLASIDDDMHEYNEAKEKLEEQEGKAVEEEKEVMQGLQECSKQQELFSTKNMAIQKKRDELTKRFQDIGALPADAFDKYTSLSQKQLERKLVHCNGELKKYENVNKKALDQFVSFSEQKDKLGHRKTEIDNAHQSIVNLMTTLDHRKYEAIQLTFKQVSRNFEQVFKQLVPNGTGHLIMKHHESANMNDTTLDDDEEEGEEEMMGSDGEAHRPSKKQLKKQKALESAAASMVESFSGVGIRVSFTGGIADTREMQQLSGGQKTLVALALIFAIQKCDPAPFYLFDEIDAALDAQYRKAVADMIHEQASSAQFITTTFRPELLEHADMFFGVLCRNKVSHVKVVDRDAAQDFVENDQTQK